jgi:hypothetical protein
MPSTPVKLQMRGDTRRIELQQGSSSLAELLEHIGKPPALCFRAPSRLELIACWFARRRCLRRRCVRWLGRGSAAAVLHRQRG